MCVRACVFFLRVCGWIPRVGKMMTPGGEASRSFGTCHNVSVYEPMTRNTRLSTSKFIAVHHLPTCRVMTFSQSYNKSQETCGCKSMVLPTPSQLLLTSIIKVYTSYSTESSQRMWLLVFPGISSWERRLRRLKCAGGRAHTHTHTQRDVSAHAHTTTDRVIEFKPTSPMY